MCSITLVSAGCSVKVHTFAPWRCLNGCRSFEALCAVVGSAPGNCCSRPPVPFGSRTKAASGNRRTRSRSSSGTANTCQAPITRLSTPRIDFLSFPCAENLRQQEDEHVRLQGHRGGLELQGLQGHEVPWTQERAALQQEVRLFRRNTLIFYMKLRSMLMRRRLGCRDQEEAAQPEVGLGSPALGRTSPFSLLG